MTTKAAICDSRIGTRTQLSRPGLGGLDVVFSCALLPAVTTVMGGIRYSIYRFFTTKPKAVKAGRKRKSRMRVARMVPGQDRRVHVERYSTTSLPQPTPAMVAAGCSAGVTASPPRRRAPPPATIFREFRSDPNIFTFREEHAIWNPSETMSLRAISYTKLNGASRLRRSALLTIWRIRCVRYEGKPWPSS